MIDGSREQRLRRAVISVSGHGFTPGNLVTRLRNGDQIFPAMLSAIEDAAETIELVTFVYWKGNIARRFADLLAKKALEGVRVRVILDAFGSRPMDQRLISDMEAAGVGVEEFRPVVRWKFWESDHRTHRKILIVDNRIGFTGGVGIAEEWEGDARSPGEWRDTHFRVEGPAVAGMRAAFLTDWRNIGRRFELGDDLANDEHRPGEAQARVIDGSAQIGYNDAERLLEMVFAQATDRIHVQTPYFNPTERILDILLEARRRNVAIDVMVPGPHIDKRVAAILAREPIRPLLDAGARVWQYQPTMFHAKAILVDGVFAMVGSVNLNRRSAEKDEEVALALLDRELVSQLEADFAGDRDRSRLVDGDIDDVGPAQKILEKVVAPLRSEA